ncbi:hypothetical protein F5Y10DRAFT_291101 [Nemania abortiva]|nr:hypothetical protein F5Y10DRAFT_291101 [Nemania abortiva]
MPRHIAIDGGDCYPKEDAKTDIDIIAIHGLDAKSSDTWTFKSKTGECVNWLSDEDMLPCKVPSARIFTCDWPSALFEDSGYTQRTFDEFAQLLLAGIAARRQPANYAKHKERPIVFIASCLGGTILMKALVRISPEYHPVQKSVRGIVFLATPFSDTSFRDVAEWALPGLKTWAFMRTEKVSNLLHETKLNSELLKLRRDFTALYGKGGTNPLYMVAFYEKGKTCLPRKLFPWLPGFLALEKPLVDEESGILDIIQYPVSLNRQHICMNKFSGPSDGDYNLVAESIRNMLKMIHEGRPLEMAGDYINNICYKASKLEIQRISGETLPMESCYVNLVVIEDHAHKNEENQKNTPQSLQFSLQSRLNVETQDEDIQVDMWHLFDQRKEDSGEMRQPKRVLIRGHAGVGKSTLCKKLVHDFKERGMRRNMFVRILWIPLRDLKRLDKANYNLEAMLRLQYFSQPIMGEKFACELAASLEANQYKETLFILDGLDEVYEALDRENAMFDFLGTLLNLPTVIVTSRPHVSFNLGFDLELETIGFYPGQVRAYVENAFTIPRKEGKRKPNRRKIDGLQLLLQQHQLLQGLVRIPIQLDALCYVWSDDNDNLRDRSMLQTMTGIYQVIVKRLWGKDILRLQSEGGAIVRLDIDHVPLRAIETLVPNELSLLERLAFTGMVNDTISFENGDWIEILDDKISQHLWKTFPRLSFLRTSDPSAGHPIYHFIYLTFQEYFAARYFVRQWEAKKPLLFGKTEQVVEEFLMHYKYEARYDIFWRFVAGLLSLKGEEICRFFYLIGSEPLDLIGPVHGRLVMHCLSEIPLDKAGFSEQRKRLECQLGRLVALELKITKESRLVYGAEFPDTLLTKVLESAPMTGRIALAKSLKYRPSIPPRVIHLVAILYIFMRHQGALDNEVLEAIMARLEDTEREVQFIAIKILGIWVPLRNDIQNVVVKRAMDKENVLRLRAIEILGKQSQLDDRVINALVAQLEDEAHFEDDTRLEDEAQLHEAIIKTLACQSQLKEEVLRVISTQLQNKYYFVRLAAIKVLKKQSDLNDDIFRTVTAGFTLMNRQQLDADIHDMIIAWLQDKDISAQCAVLEALESWPQPSRNIVDAVVARLEEDSWSIRIHALQALGNWPQLRDNDLDALSKQLRDSKDCVREAAARAFRNRPQPKDSNNNMVIEVAAGLFQNCPQPNDNIINAIMEHLECPDWQIRQALLQVIGSWPNPSDELLVTIATCLKDKDWHEWHCVCLHVGRCRL